MLCKLLHPGVEDQDSRLRDVALVDLESPKPLNILDSEEIEK